MSICTLAGCSDDSDKYNPEIEQDSYVETYEDYSFWEQENKLRFFIPLSGRGEIDDSGNISEIGDLELPKAYQERAEKLKKAMVSYFKEKYNLDISSKLSNQKLKAFTSRRVDEMTMGYVDPEHPEYLNLNQCLFGEYAMLFDNTYVHESLHQIGFRSKKSTMIDEGITDALTDLILKKANIESFPTDSYFAARTLAYQILEVDTGIAKFYLENQEVQIQNRINAKLKNIPRPFDERDAGEFLNIMIEGMTNGISGNVDPYYIAFQAQEIVRAYCQTFNPSHQSIDYIRNNYLAEAYEKTTIEKEGDRYNFNLQWYSNSE